VVAVAKGDSSKTAYFVSRTLLFGETAAVYAFNRVARALQRICIGLGDIVLVNYFDDYPQLEAAQLAESARATLKWVFGLLGWELAGEEKDQEFKKEFVVLGVKVDMAHAAAGRIIVANKPARVAEVCSVIANLLKEAKGTPSEVATITARVHHMESVHFGRCAAAALRVLRRFGGGQGGPARFNGEETAALEWLARALPVAKARTIKVFATARPVVVFTDGACEGDVASCGAVLFDGETRTEFFGTRVPEDVHASWRQGTSEQVIGQAELWPVLLALLTWSDELAGRQVMFFIDQDAARQGLVKAYSPSKPSAEIIGQVFMKVAELEVYPWFSSVPTSSNPADPASRLNFALVQQEFPKARSRDAAMP
jgi:hypothetical protein